MSLQKLKNSYSIEKKHNDKRYHYWAYLVVRPASFYASWLFIKLGFTASQVTFLGLLVLFAGFLIMGIGVTSWYIIIGAFLINIWQLLDFTDGNIARYNEASSVNGEYFDWVVGHFFHFVMPLSVGFHLSYEHPFYLYLGIMGSLMELSRIAISNKKKILFNDETNNTDSIGFFKRFAYMVNSFKAPMLLFFALLSGAEFWLFFYVIFSFLIWFKLIIEGIIEALKEN